MKIEMEPLAIRVHRGEEVEVGNVYCNNRNPAFKNYRVVVGFATGRFREPWNATIMLHVDTDGNIVGCSREPRTVISNHWDRIGKIKEFPKLKINWLQHEPKIRKRKNTK